MKIAIIIVGGLGFTVAVGAVFWMIVRIVEGLPDELD